MTQLRGQAILAILQKLQPGRRCFFFFPLFLPVRFLAAPKIAQRRAARLPPRQTIQCAPGWVGRRNRRHGTLPGRPGRPSIRQRAAVASTRPVRRTPSCTYPRRSAAGCSTCRGRRKTPVPPAWRASTTRLDAWKPRRLCAGRRNQRQPGPQIWSRSFGAWPAAPAPGSFSLQFRAACLRPPRTRQSWSGRKFLLGGPRWDRGADFPDGGSPRRREKKNPRQRRHSRRKNSRSFRRRRTAPCFSNRRIFGSGPSRIAILRRLPVWHFPPECSAFCRHTTRSFPAYTRREAASQGENTTKKAGNRRKENPIKTTPAAAHAPVIAAPPPLRPLAVFFFPYRGPVSLPRRASQSRKKKSPPTPTSTTPAPAATTQGPVLRRPQNRRRSPPPKKKFACPPVLYLPLFSPLSHHQAPSPFPRQPRRPHRMEAWKSFS